MCGVGGNHMARRATFESSESDTDSDFSSASPRTTSPAPPVEESAHSTERGEPIKGGSSNSDDENKIKGLKRPQS
jgi:hypothetical protein